MGQEDDLRVVSAAQGQDIKYVLLRSVKEKEWEQW